jgi:hypothetical protein
MTRRPTMIQSPLDNRRAGHAVAQLPRTKAAVIRYFQEQTPSCRMFLEELLARYSFFLFDESVTAVTDSLSLHPYIQAQRHRSGARRETMARKSKRAAGLIDCRIHLHCHRTHSSESDQHPRRISLSAIGRCLKDQYDALASPIPQHLAALVKRLGMQQ